MSFLQKRGDFEHDFQYPLTIFVQEERKQSVCLCLFNRGSLSPSLSLTGISSIGVVKTGSSVVRWGWTLPPDPVEIVRRILCVAAEIRVLKLTEVGG